jgi:hypothetical protein
MKLRWLLPLLLGLAVDLSQSAAKEQILEPKLRYLRVAGAPEWSDFPKQGEATRLGLRFSSERNAGEWALQLRQQDVRQTWRVLLNGRELGRLPPDENDMVVFLPVPAGALVAGENLLVVEQVGKTADDVRVGEIVLHDRLMSEVLAEATVDISVVDEGQLPKAIGLPCRITIVNKQGILMTVGAVSNDRLAVRPGVIYSGNGQAVFGLPAGDYTIYAGRGFEYSLASVQVKLRPSDRVRKRLAIRREVPTEGYVSCDTHVHTLTYSGHGDSTIAERVLTIAGEGIELPVATEHNRHVDYHAAALKAGMRKYFTPIVGNEVTTAAGHFNIFPVRPEDPIPDFKLKDWKSISASITERTKAKVIILNHPRDLHSGFRPLGPERHLALIGDRLDGWKLPANAMEVINSGAQQSDPMRLFHDWFGLLNRGVYLTPIGASDSHDVARYFVGQARTYTRCKDDRPGEIDLEEAVDSLLKGRVLVSCGLLADIKVNGKYGPGDLVPGSEEVKVSVRVLGPSWAPAERVELYANGRKIREAVIAKPRAGVQWNQEWTLPALRHDAHLVAIATGPPVTGLYWPIAKPYQPSSPRVERKIIGATGAVWLDGDGDGKFTSAHDYAQRLFRESDGQAAVLVKRLADYDEAVASQAAGLLQGKGVSLQDPVLSEAGRKAGKHVESGFQAFIQAWRDSQIARGQAPGP